MEDGIVGDLPDEDLDPADIPPLPIFLKESYALAKASADDNLPLLRSLFEQHERSHDYDEREALSIAVRNSNYAIISFLLSEGVAPRMADVIQAIELKSYPVLQAILDSGFNINQEVSGSYPPPLAMTFHDLELTKWFLRRGADPNARCYFEITPLSIAVQQASFTVIVLLFDHGASVKYGSPLSYAVRRKQNDRFHVLQYLLSKGACINNIMFQHDILSYCHFKSLGLGTPLHEASENGDLQLVDFLLNNNADPTIEDTRGNTPIQLARSGNHDSVVCRLEVFLNALSDTGPRL